MFDEPACEGLLALEVYFSAYVLIERVANDVADGFCSHQEVVKQIDRLPAQLVELPHASNQDLANLGRDDRIERRREALFESKPELLRRLEDAIELFRVDLLSLLANSLDEALQVFVDLQ